MSVQATVFLTRKKGLKFSTVWIDEGETEKAIEELGLNDVIPDGTVRITSGGRYVKYSIDEHAVFIKVMGV